MALDLEQYRAELEAALTTPGASGEGVFSAAVVRELIAPGSAATPGRRALARAAAEGHLRLASADEIAEAHAILRGPLVATPGGDRVAPGEVDRLLAGEPDAERRRELGAARLRAIETHLTRPLGEAAGRRAEAARALGATDAAGLVAAAGAIDLPALAGAAARILDATDDALTRRLDAAARAALGIPASALDPADLPRLIDAPQRAGDLPGAAVAGAIAATRERLGGGTGHPPPPEGVIAAALAGLRAAGIGLARDGASPRLPVEARLCPDPALAMAAGHLLEGLLAEPWWLRRHIGLQDPDPVAVAAAVARLVAVRAAAAGTIVLAGAAGADGAFDRALGLRWPAPLRLAEGLGDLGPADELRGRMLGAILARHLREDAGERWVDDPRSGALLRELWLEGGALDPDELARELGAEGLDPDVLAAEMEAAPV